MKKLILTIAVFMVISIALTGFAGCGDELEGTSWEMVEVVETDRCIILCAGGENVPDNIIKTRASCKIDNDGMVVISCEFLRFEARGKIEYEEAKKGGIDHYTITYDDGTTGELSYFHARHTKDTNVSTKDGAGFSYTCEFDMEISAGIYTFYFRKV